MNFLCGFLNKIKEKSDKNMLPRQQLLRRNSKRFVLGDEDPSSSATTTVESNVSIVFEKCENGNGINNINSNVINGKFLSVGTGLT